MGLSVPVLIQPELVYEIFEKWLVTPSKEVNWLIRHALRHPAKNGDKTALKLRTAAK
jgi:3-methyladenine DNA glycosylase AlkC